MRSACFNLGERVRPNRGLDGCDVALAALGLASRDEGPLAAPANAAMRDEILEGLAGRLLGDAAAESPTVVAVEVGSGERGLAGELVAEG